MLFNLHKQTFSLKITVNVFYSWKPRSMKCSSLSRRFTVVRGQKSSKDRTNVLMVHKIDYPGVSLRPWATSSGDKPLCGIKILMQSVPLKMFPTDNSEILETKYHDFLDNFINHGFRARKISIIPDVKTLADVNLKLTNETRSHVQLSAKSNVIVEHINMYLYAHSPSSHSIIPPQCFCFY